MDNLSIARVLTEIGDLLEIKGENPFKIRAYRNAAETISHEARAVDSLSDADRRALQGIGRDIAAKIAELISTGAIAYHQDLVAQFPPSILDLLNLPGVGPKTVALLYKELNIRTLEELEAAAGNGRLRAVRGMGARKEEQILKALAAQHRYTGRRLASEAESIATSLVSSLTERAPDTTVRIVGSLRRGCETAGDIDVLATGPSTDIIHAFTSNDSVERIMLHGETKSSVLLSGGIQADLRLVPSESAGAALQYFTGSKTHNIALRDRALARGWKLNDTGSIASTTINAWPEATSRSCMPRWGWPMYRRSSGKVGTRLRRPNPARCRASSTGRTFAATCTPIQISPMAAPISRPWCRRRRRRGFSTWRSRITASRWRWPTVSMSAACWNRRARFETSTHGWTASRSSPASSAISVQMERWTWRRIAWRNWTS